MAIKGNSITVTLSAWDTANNEPKTGDAGNITAYVSLDGGTVSETTNSVSELDATNAAGDYPVTLTDAEMDADFVNVSGKSSTADVVIYPVKIVTEQGLLTTVRDLEQADSYLDTSTSPYSIVMAQSGTGDDASPTVLQRFYCYDSNDDPVTDTTTRVTKLVAETL